MSALKHLILGLILLGTIYSCKVNNNLFNNNHSIKEYLLDVQNDTTRHDIYKLKVKDANIYSVLDSALFFAKQCEYFDENIPYLHAFLINLEVIENGEISYKIEGNISMDFALSWSFSIDIGGSPLSKGFYYKNFLFVVNDKNLDKDILNKVFWEETDCTISVQPTRLRNNNVFSSYLIFKKDTVSYKISENKMCGPKVLITK
jgi:hypothetical protein